MTSPGPCLACGGTDYGPQGFYRVAGWSIEGGTVDNPAKGPYHFHCADLVAATRKAVNVRQTMKASKSVTSKPNRRDKKR